jgi:hypothetical protein
MTVLIVLLTVWPAFHDDLSQIESSYNYNDSLKQNKVFRYRSYKGQAPSYELWRERYKQAEYSEIVFADTDKFLFMKESYGKDVTAAELAKKPGTTFSTMFTSEIFLRDKDSSVFYIRSPSLEHAQLGKDAVTAPASSPYNFGFFGSDNQATLDSLLRRTRAGDFTVETAKQVRGDVHLSFRPRDGSRSSAWDWTIDPQKNYVGLDVVLYNPLKDRNANHQRAIFRDYQMTKDGLWYPRVVDKQVVQNGKPVLFCTIEFMEVSDLTKENSDFYDQVPVKTGVSISDLGYSWIHIPERTIIRNSDLSRLYEECEAASTARQARRQPGSNYFAVVAIVGGVLVASLVALVVGVKVYRRVIARRTAIP